MKNIQYILFILVIVVFIIATITLNTNTTEAKNRMLTTEELDLLRLAGRKVGDNYDEYLTSADKSLLDAAQSTWAYLAQKYPSHQFELLACASPTLLHRYTLFTLYDVQTPERSFDIRSTWNDDVQAYEMKDTFYTQLIEPAYHEALSTAIERYFGKDFSLLITFDQFYSEACNETTTLQQAMELNNSDSPRPNTWILLEPSSATDEASFSQAAQQLKQEIEQMPLRGRYHVYWLSAPLAANTPKKDIVDLIGRHTENAPSFSGLLKW